MSGIFKLGWRDLVKGAIVSVVTSVLSMVLGALNKGETLDGKKIVIVALSTFIAYLLKQFVTDENGKLGGKI